MSIAVTYGVLILIFHRQALRWYCLFVGMMKYVSHIYLRNQTYELITVCYSSFVSIFLSGFEARLM